MCAIQARGLEHLQSQCREWGRDGDRWVLRTHWPGSLATGELQVQGVTLTQKKKNDGGARGGAYPTQRHMCVEHTQIEKR